MVQSTQARHRYHGRRRSRPLFHWPAVRRVLLQGVVNAVVVVVPHVFAHEPAKVWLVQRDDMVQDFAAGTSDPAFGGSILPGRLDARPFWFQTRRLQKRNHVSIEFRAL